MKLNEIKRTPIAEARYRVTLSTYIGGSLLAFQTRLNAGSPREAADTVRRLFKKERGEIQSAVMRNWEVREVTPLAQRK